MIRISEPRISLSKSDKKLLHLVAHILLQENSPNTENSNVPDGEVSLSDQEAEKLLDLIEKFLKSPDFKEANSFVGEISILDASNEKKARSIFSTNHRRRGTQEPALHHRWYELKARLGKKNHGYMGKIIHPMDEQHFWAMERKIFNVLGLNPRVIEILLKMGHPYYQSALSQKKQKVDLREPIENLKKTIKINTTASKINLASLAYIIANMTALFTTRDWDAASFSSSMVGHTMGLKKKKD